MPFQINATKNLELWGAVNLAILGDPNTTAKIARVDGSLPQQPVRNFDGIDGTGTALVVDTEAPFGRPVSYNLLSPTNVPLAQSNQITLTPPSHGRSLIRSVLRPSVEWMWVEPQDETGVEWSSSTTVHEVVGSDTPVVVGEIRQRYKGTISFLMPSTGEADQLVRLLRDGTPILLRHSPCAGSQTRDLLFYSLDVTEKRVGYSPSRIVSVDYQSTKFVYGWTEEPPYAVGWTFEALSLTAPDFGVLSSLWPNFAFMSLQPLPPWPASRRDAAAHGYPYVA